MKLVAGNWKMNLTQEDAIAFANDFADLTFNERVRAVIAPPFVFISDVETGLYNYDFENEDADPERHPRKHVAAQDVSAHTNGAFTGEVSATMLSSMGVEYTIVGHSERRQHFGESGALIAEKVARLLEVGINPIFCCGESLEVRQAGNDVAFVTAQIEESLFHLSAEAFQNIVIAYEPIWAIGTGVTASPEQAEAMHKSIREFIAAKYGTTLAKATLLLYGGSCNPKNADSLFACPNIDGGLIGGASLHIDDFKAIIAAAERHSN